MMTLAHKVITVCGALGLGCAALGCTTTTSIRPDQLPLLTDAAAGPVRAPMEVIGVSGQTVRMDGTLDAVVITGPGRPRTFHAPLASAIRGPTLVVREEEANEALPLPWIQEAKVTYAHKDVQLGVGVTLDIVGSLFFVGGLTLLIGGFVSDAHNSSDVQLGGIVGLFIGVPMMGLIAPAFLAPGIELTMRGARKPKYPPQVSLNF